MNKQNVTKFFKMVKTTINRRSPEILTGIGVAGMITTTVLAVKATPKALKKIEEKKLEVYDELDPLDVPSQALPEDVKLKPIEVVKVTWKCYIPAVVTGAASIACIVGASKVNLKRNAALATAYNLSQTALTEYKEKVVETIGDKKEQKIRESIAQDKIDKNPPSEEVNKSLVILGNGDFPVKDTLSGRYFISNENKLDAIENKINSKLLSYDYVSLNEIYDELELEPTSLGDQLGWNRYRDGEFRFNKYNTSKLPDGRPCLVLDYHVGPRYEYDSSY